MRTAWILALGLAANGVAFGAPEVVADTACPYYSVDIAAFATCDGDRVAHAASALTVSEAPPPDARAQTQPRTAPASDAARGERRADAARARALKR